MLAWGRNFLQCSQEKKSAQEVRRGVENFYNAFSPPPLECISILPPLLSNFLLKLNFLLFKVGAITSRGFAGSLCLQKNQHYIPCLNSRPNSKWTASLMSAEIRERMSRDSSPLQVHSSVIIIHQYNDLQVSLLSTVSQPALRKTRPTRAEFDIK
jgi:hypothetical protein